MPVTEQSSRRRTAWFFMAFAVASLVMPRSRSSRLGDHLSIQVEDRIGKRATFGVGHGTPGTASVHKDLRLDTIELNVLEEEKTAIEQELAAAKNALTSLQEEKTTLENKLGEVLTTSKAQKEELETITRDLHILQRELLEVTGSTMHSPKYTSENLESSKTEVCEQSFGQKLRMFLSSTGGYWNRYTSALFVTESSMSASYSKSRDDMLRWLNNTASSVGESPTWLGISSQIVVANCDFLLLLVEMFVVLLCVDFALSSFINWSQERIDRTASSSTHSIYSER